MRWRVLSVGRGMPAPVRELLANYSERLVRHGGIELIELAEAQRDPGYRVAQALHEEGKRLLARRTPAAPLVILDRQGETLSSEALAAWLDRKRQEGNSTVEFAIGGPDGLDQELATEAALRLSFGPMTFPHMLARVLLFEQIYRAVTILNKIPYHR